MWNIGLDGIVVLMLGAAGLIGGLLVCLGIALMHGPTWWLLALPLVGAYVGGRIGAYIERHA